MVEVEKERGMRQGKQYLGDGVYVSYDDYHIVLSVENGVAVIDRIYLDPGVWAELVRYVERMRAATTTDGGPDA